jgi:hypothetical protein
MTSTSVPRTPRERLLGAALAASLSLGGCNGDAAQSVQGDSPDSSQPRGAGSLVEVSPLTGLPVGDDAPEHPIMIVKIDNTASAAPAAGLSGADLVVEELVEGGSTRSRRSTGRAARRGGPGAFHARHRHRASSNRRRRSWWPPAAHRKPASSRSSGDRPAGGGRPRLQPRRQPGGAVQPDGRPGRARRFLGRRRSAAATSSVRRGGQLAGRQGAKTIEATFSGNAHHVVAIRGRHRLGQSQQPRPAGRGLRARQRAGAVGEGREMRAISTPRATPCPS